MLPVGPTAVLFGPVDEGMEYGGGAGPVPVGEPSVELGEETG